VPADGQERESKRACVCACVCGGEGGGKGERVDEWAKPGERKKAHAKGLVKDDTGQRTWQTSDQPCLQTSEQPCWQTHSKKVCEMRRNRQSLFLFCFVSFRFENPLDKLTW
jgi:hypothetical protein